MISQDIQDYQMVSDGLENNGYHSKNFTEVTTDSNETYGNISNDYQLHLFQGREDASKDQMMSPNMEESQIVSECWKADTHHTNNVIETTNHTNTTNNSISNDFNLHFSQVSQGRTDVYPMISQDIQHNKIASDGLEDTTHLTKNVKDEITDTNTTNNNISDDFNLHFLQVSKGREDVWNASSQMISQDIQENTIVSESFEDNTHHTNNDTYAIIDTNTTNNNISNNCNLPFSHVSEGRENMKTSISEVLECIKTLHANPKIQENEVYEKFQADQNYLSASPQVLEEANTVILNDLKNNNKDMCTYEIGNADEKTLISKETDCNIDNPHDSSVNNMFCNESLLTPKEKNTEIFTFSEVNVNMLLNTCFNILQEDESRPSVAVEKSEDTFDLVRIFDSHYQVGNNNNITLSDFNSLQEIHPSLNNLPNNKNSLIEHNIGNGTITSHDISHSNLIVSPFYGKPIEASNDQLNCNHQNVNPNINCVTVSSVISNSLNPIDTIDKPLNNNMFYCCESDNESLPIHEIQSTETKKCENTENLIFQILKNSPMISLSNMLHKLSMYSVDNVLLLLNLLIHQGAIGRRILSNGITILWGISKADPTISENDESSPCHEFYKLMKSNRSNQSELRILQMKLNSATQLLQKRRTDVDKGERIISAAKINPIVTLIRKWREVIPKLSEELLEISEGSNKKNKLRNDDDGFHNGGHYPFYTSRKRVIVDDDDTCEEMNPNECNSNNRNNYSGMQMLFYKLGISKELVQWHEESESFEI